MLDNGLPHGKHVDHLSVVAVETTEGALLPREMVATYLPVMECANSPEPPSWGVLLSHAAHPERGMHLFSDAVAWLPDVLVQCAVDNPTGDIDLEHTVRGDWEVFVTLTPAGAVDVSDRIKAAAAGAP